jgi:hypothetical protein
MRITVGDYNFHETSDIKRKGKERKVDVGQMHNVIKGFRIQAVMGVRNKEDTLVHAIDFEARVLGEVFSIIRSARPKWRTEVEL